MPEHNEKPASPYQTTYEILLKKYLRCSSKLKPQVKSWEEDLPGNSNKQTSVPRAIYINYIDSDYMEIPRYENISWSIMWISLLSCFFVFMAFVYYIVFPGIYVLLEGDFLFYLVFLLYFSLVIWIVKLLLIYPRGTPVRFNRARQKVYVYEFKRRWNPWARWRAEIKVFDWADIHGEMIRQVGRYDSGHRLSCAVCKPGTFEVVDRFMLSWTVGHPEMLRGLWSFCCHYMQYQPVPERPLIAKHPRSWCPRNNIHWPEAIDRESTTAPQGI